MSSSHDHDGLTIERLGREGYRRFLREHLIAEHGGSDAEILFKHTATLERRHEQSHNRIAHNQALSRTYHSDALGTVTISEDDRPTWDSRCEHGSVDHYACSMCYEAEGDA